VHTSRRRAAIAACITGLLSIGALAPPAGARAAQEPSAKPDRSQLTSKQLPASGRKTVAKSRTSRLAKSDQDLLARTDAQRVPVVVKYDYDSIATYQGEPGGAPATAPSATGRALTQRDATTSSYARQLASTETAITANVKRTVPAARIGTSLRVVYGGVAMVVPANQAKQLLTVPGVVAVQEDARNQKLTDSSPEFVGAPPVWQALGGQSTAGAGVLFADLDSGVWPEHPSFDGNADLPAKPTRPGGGAIDCNFGDNPLTPAVDPFACNNKLVGGSGFLDTYNTVQDPERFGDTARDSDGHGTHTTSTAAGGIVEHADPLGVDRGTISGLAPGAAVVEYKVCGLQGCFSSDSAAAVGQSILDGADVINFSISGGVDPLTDPVELAFLDAYDAGVFVASSAGNDGPGASTANHLSPWVTSVAASTQSRAFESTLSLTGDDAATLDLTGASITAGVDDDTPVVLAQDVAGYGTELCDEEPPADDTFAGLIVACERGGNGRIEKGYNLSLGGAEGMILYNPALADTETDNHWVPTVHLADGADFLDFVDAHGPVTATFTDGKKTQGQGDVMASFSSRGPAGQVIKPDITAPGVQILAGQTPVLDEPGLGPEGEYFMAIAGTSMSGPHVAGAGILLKAAHPDWTPGQIKSALMTTATTAVVKEDEETPADPFDMGAGRIDIAKAAAPGLTLDEDAQDFVDLTGTVNAVDLNIASINATVMPGRETTTRTFTNVGAGSATYRVSATAPAGSTITVSPSTFTVAAGQSRDVAITIETAGHLGEQQFGQIDLAAAGRNPLHLPVAWIPTQGAISATSTCAQATLAFGASTTCDVTVQNASFGDTTADITATANPKLEVTSATGAGASHTASSASVAGVALAGREPGVPALVPQDGFEGYIELAGDAVPEPDPIGDEEFVSYSGFGSFVYNGQSYSEVNVNSNGYLVVGPAGSADGVCCPPQESPDPAPPNNVIAPYWSDLSGDTGTPSGEPPLGVYAATFSDDDGNEWLVIETRLTDCCDGDPTHGDTKVSQVWLGLNGTQDITIDYEPGNLPNSSGIEQEPGDPLATVGVQNELGQGAGWDPEADPLPTDFFVESTDPVPGDSATLTVGLKGKAQGAGVLHSEITSPDVHGTTVVESAIAVSAPPVAGLDAFITRSYEDFLGRKPTSAELAKNRTALSNGSLTRRKFTLGLATSNEYLGHEVDQRFAQILGRSPDPTGRAYWINKLRTGLSETALVNSITASNEFYAKAGSTPSGFITRAHQVLVDRSPTTAETAGFTAYLANGGARSSVANSIYQSEESRRLRVTGLYQHFLHRNPDTAGRNYWANVIKTKGDIALALELATSNEYVHRTR
jgi:hypothetical protein